MHEQKDRQDREYRRRLDDGKVRFWEGKDVFPARGLNGDPSHFPLVFA